MKAISLLLWTSETVSRQSKGFSNTPCSIVEQKTNWNRLGDIEQLRKEHFPLLCPNISVHPFMLEFQTKDRNQYRSFAVFVFQGFIHIRATEKDLWNLFYASFHFKTRNSVNFFIGEPKLLQNIYTIPLKSNKFSYSNSSVYILRFCSL